MIERYRILAEDSGYTVPAIGSEVMFRAVSAVDATSPIYNIPVFITATDPTWGPRFNRIEGFYTDDSGEHAVLGFHRIGETARDFVGLIEIHRDET